MQEERDLERQKQSFSTQASILQELGVVDTKGICSPLANLYAIHKLGGSRAFLDEGPAKTYHCAKEMEAHQADIDKRVSATHGKEMGSLMAMHAAFFDHHKVFKGEKVPVSQLKTQAGAQAVFQDSEHVLVNYPTSEAKTGTSPSFHQVYFGHTRGTNRCSYFNSNRPGGEREGNCTDVLNDFISDVKKSAVQDGREQCLVGRTLGG